MAVATDREYGLIIGGESAEPETLELCLETKSANVATGARPINPFWL